MNHSPIQSLHRRPFHAVAILFLGAAILLLVLSLGSCGKADFRTGGRVHLNYTDSIGYHFVRDGKPFLVRGVSGIQRLPLLKEYGGNTVRNYRLEDLPEVLDLADSLGIAVIADLPLPAYASYSDPDGEDLRALRDSLLRTVERFRHHPALLCWMLGNELFYSGYTSGYQSAYNEIARAVRAADPDHPISTTVIPQQLPQLLLSWEGLSIDFYSFNVFGNFESLKQLQFWAAPLWRGPYLISEWSYNGPWETVKTVWAAPIEDSSPAKARHLRERYLVNLEGADDPRRMGSMAFFWGNKYERTPDWYSFFDEEGSISEMAWELGNLWNQRRDSFPGPQLYYITLEGKGATEDLLLPSSTAVRATSTFLRPPAEEYTAVWQIRREDWLGEGQTGEAPPPLSLLFTEGGVDGASFVTPRQPGPYRLYCRIYDQDGYFSSANVPFYVLNTRDAE